MGDRPVLLATHRRAAERALDALRAQTARRVVQMIQRVSRQHPGCHILLDSSMGTLVLWIDDEIVEHDDAGLEDLVPLISFLAKRYGWGWVVPVGEVEARDGKVISNSLT